MDVSFTIGEPNRSGHVLAANDTNDKVTIVKCDDGIWRAVIQAQTVYGCVAVCHEITGDLSSVINLARDDSDSLVA